MSPYQGEIREKSGNLISKIVWPPWARIRGAVGKYLVWHHNFLMRWLIYWCNTCMESRSSLEDDALIVGERTGLHVPRMLKVNRIRGLDC